MGFRRLDRREFWLVLLFVLDFFDCYNSYPCRVTFSIVTCLFFVYLFLLHEIFFCSQLVVRPHRARTWSWCQALSSYKPLTILERNEERYYSRGRACTSLLDKFRKIKSLQLNIYCFMSAIHSLYMWIVFSL